MGGSIDVRNLRVQRGDFALEVDELSIRSGEMFAVLGTTGSGKTVFIEAVAGAYRIDPGSIFLDGKDITTLPIQQRHLGILYQDHALFPHMSVRENISYGLRRKRVAAEERNRRVDEIIELFGIAGIADRMPGVISGGESQRCALARALVLEPQILILDEPFSSLDPTTKQQMYRLVRDIHRRFDCTIVFVTHDFAEAQLLASRIAVILNGRLRLITDADRLFDTSHPADVRAFLGMDPAGETGAPAR